MFAHMTRYAIQNKFIFSPCHLQKKPNELRIFLIWYGFLLWSFPTLVRIIMIPTCICEMRITFPAVFVKNFGIYFTRKDRERSSRGLRILFFSLCGLRLHQNTRYARRNQVAMGFIPPAVSPLPSRPRRSLKNWGYFDATFCCRVHRQIVLTAADCPRCLFPSNPRFFHTCRNCVVKWTQDFRHLVNINLKTRCPSYDSRFHFCSALECNEPLGMGDGTISDGQISASSELRLYFGPANARLNFSGTDVRVGAWVAGTNDSNQWLQVDFGNETKVTGIDTQGRRCKKCRHWVKEYTISYSHDNATFHQYKENAQNKVFQTKRFQ